MAKAKRVPSRESFQPSSAIGITFVTVCIHVASIEVSCNSLPDRPGEGYMGPLTCDPLYIWIVIIKACCPFHRDLQPLWRRYPDIVTCVRKDTSSQGTFSQIQSILKNMYISFLWTMHFVSAFYARAYIRRDKPNIFYRMWWVSMSTRAEFKLLSSTCHGYHQVLAQLICVSIISLLYNLFI